MALSPGVNGLKHCAGMSSRASRHWTGF